MRTSQMNLSIVALVCCCTSLFVSVASAQRGGRPTDLLSRADVRKELEILDDQVEKLEALSAKRRERFREMYAELGDLSREERNQKLRERFTEFNEQTKKDLGGILLPHQSKRLDQIVVQYQLRSGLSRTLGNSAVSEALGISDEQKEQIQTRATQLGQEFQKKINEFRNELREQLLQELTPKQRAMWKDLVGEPFEFQQASSRNRN